MTTRDFEAWEAAALQELERIKALVKADPRYEPNVEGSFRRVARALVGHDTEELIAASCGVVWDRLESGGFVRRFAPEEVPAVLERLAALQGRMATFQEDAPCTR